jgi:hypothetical protein
MGNVRVSKAPGKAPAVVAAGDRADGFDLDYLFGAASVLQPKSNQTAKSKDRGQAFRL